jgi:hypothetical protein
MRQRVPSLNYKMSEGIKVPSNAILASLYSRIDKFYKDKVGYSKQEVLDAIENRDIKTLRLISRRASTLSSGIYSRML